MLDAVLLVDNHHILIIRPRKVTTETTSSHGTSRPTAAANTGTKYIMPNIVLLRKTAQDSSSVEAGTPRMICIRISTACPKNNAGIRKMLDRSKLPCQIRCGNIWNPTRSVTTSQAMTPLNEAQNRHGTLVFVSVVATVTPEISNPLSPYLMNLMVHIPSC